MSDLYALMNAVGPNGLHRAQAHAYPDVWANLMNLRVESKKYTFEGRQYLKEITRDANREIAFRKSAQMGATVTALIRTLHHLIEWEWNGMYLLPLKAGTTTFTQGRINTIINSSKTLKSYFTSVDNANHKKTICSNLYIRGTNVETELREVPVDFMIWDERDKMVEDNLPIALTRMDGSRHKHVFKLSTPLIPEFGIDLDFLESDQRYWYIKCPHCRTQITLDWDEHVKVDIDRPQNSHLECDHCHKEITHAQMIEASNRGEWVPTTGKNDLIHGYHINQLYSPTKQVEELARTFIRGQDDEKYLKELYNSALGLGYISKGDKLTPQALDACRSNDYRIDFKQIPQEVLENPRPLFVGIDVGNILHVQMSELTNNYMRRKLFVGTCTWDELFDLLRPLTGAFGGAGFTGVIDSRPEGQKAKEFAEYFKQMGCAVFLATYSETLKDTFEWKFPKAPGDVGEVTINRSLGFDMSHSHYFRKQIILPGNMRDIGEYHRDLPYNGWYHQMMTQVRIVIEDNNGNPLVRYVKQGKRPDHWDHSDLYEMTASSIIIPQGGIDNMPKKNEIKTAEEMGINPDQLIDTLVDDPFEHGGWASGLSIE